MTRLLKFVCSVLLLSQTASFAIGALFSRPLNSSVTYNKVWIKSVDATVQIDGQVAGTHVDQIFYNEMNSTVETVWIFPLPQGAVVTELYYWFNGQRYQGSIREAQKARSDYENRIRQRLDPALLEYLGDNLFRLSIAPVNPLSEMRTELTYIQMLPYEFGHVDYSFLLNATGLSPKPLNRISVSGRVDSPFPFKYMRSPSFGSSTDFQLTRVNDKRYEFVYGDENYLPDRDLVLQYETVRDAVQVNVSRYTPSPADSIGSESFYAVWITPPDSLAADEQIPKKIVFAADVSSSMEGERILQLKKCLNAFLDNLAPIDQFNIVAFGTTIVPFRPDLVAATPAALAEARTFITNLGAVGLTNIDEALKISLQQSFSPESFNTIVFLTDGYPTWGVTFLPDILANAKTRNVEHVKIFSFGVGEDVSKSLLLQLAADNGGYATFINKTTDIAITVGNHFKRMSKPVLTDLEIVLDGLITSDKYPRPLPDLFWGSQVVQLGLYANSGDIAVKLNAMMRGQPVQMSSQVYFDNTPGGYSFVPRLWAQAKIDYLLEQMAMYGEQPELKNQIIELSLKFQILTPYTAFYSDPTTRVMQKDKDQKPTDLTLMQNYPNPFNASTTIAFVLPARGWTTLRIYDLTGRLLAEVFSGNLAAGRHSFIWNGCNADGVAVPSGIYIGRLEHIAAGGQRTSRMVKLNLIR